MTRFYQNLLGVQPGLETGMSKLDALVEAKAWLRALPAAEAKSLGKSLSRETVESVPTLPEPTDKADRPYAHPFITGRRSY